jgi:hypothetical protein
MEGRFAYVLRGHQGYDVRGGKTDFIADVIKHMGEVAAISTSDGTCEIDEDVACKTPATLPKNSACVQVVISSHTSDADGVAAWAGELPGVSWHDIGKPSGDAVTYAAAVTAALDSCKCVVACISSRYATSMHCKNIFQVATDKGKPIIALIVDADSEAPNFPPSGLGFLLGDKVPINAVSSSTWKEDLLAIIQEFSAPHPMGGLS